MTDNREIKPIYSDEVVRILENCISLIIEKKAIEKIKLSKLKDNSYTWTIETIGIDVDRLGKIDSELKKRFGATNG